MKQLFFSPLILLIAFFAVPQDAIAQWNGNVPLHPAVIYNNDPGTSKVGIGTTSPLNKLQVVSASTNDGIRVSQSGNTAATLSLQAQGAGGRNWALFSTGPGNSQGAGHLTFYDWTSNVERMRINSDGKVGVGTPAPTCQLHVNTAAASGVVADFSNSAGNHMFLTHNLAVGGYGFASLPGDMGLFWSKTTGWNDPNTGPGFVIAPHTGNIWAGMRLAADGKVNLPGYSTIIGTDIKRLGLGSAYGLGTSYIGFNGVRGKTDMNGKASWEFNGDGSNNGGSVIYGDVGGNMRFVTKPSTGGGNISLLDVDVFSQTRVSITNIGNVGIGFNNPTYKLEVNGSAYATGSWLSSDRRYKKNIQTLGNALGKVLALRGAEYNFRTEEFKDINFDKGKQFGFIAQELKEVLPELVQQDAQGMMAVNYIGVIPMLVEALKEEHKVMEEKETRIANLEAENNALQTRLARIEAALGLAADRQPTDTKTAPVSAKISPNPTTGLLTVELQNTAAARTVIVKIMDAAGREVAGRSVAAGEHRIQFDLSRLPAGAYVAQVIADGQLVSSNKVQLLK